MSTVASPIQFKVMGQLHLDDVTVFHACRCLRYMTVKWHKVTIFDAQGNELDPPKKGALLLLTKFAF